MMCINLGFDNNGGNVFDITSEPEAFLVFWRVLRDEKGKVVRSSSIERNDCSFISRMTAGYWKASEHIITLSLPHYRDS